MESVHSNEPIQTINPLEDDVVSRIITQRIFLEKFSDLRFRFVYDLDVMDEYVMDHETAEVYFKFTGGHLLSCRHVLRMGNEKNLYFLIFEVLRFPILMLQLPELRIEPGSVEEIKDYLSFRSITYQTSLEYARSLSKSHTNDRIEFIIRDSNRILCVLLGMKCLTVNEFEEQAPRWQLYTEMLAAMHTNIENGYPEGVVFGAVTDVDEWYFVKLHYDASTGEYVFNSSRNIFFGTLGGLHGSASFSRVVSFLLQIFLFETSTSKITTIDKKYLKEKFEKVMNDTNEFVEEYLKHARAEIEREKHLFKSEALEAIRRKDREVENMKKQIEELRRQLADTK